MCNMSISTCVTLYNNVATCKAIIIKLPRSRCYIVSEGNKLSLNAVNSYLLLCSIHKVVCGNRLVIIVMYVADKLN